MLPRRRLALARAGPGRGPLALGNGGAVSLFELLLGRGKLVLGLTPEAQRLLAMLGRLGPPAGRVTQGVVAKTAPDQLADRRVDAVDAEPGRRPRAHPLPGEQSGRRVERPPHQFEVVVHRRSGVASGPTLLLLGGLGSGPLGLELGFRLRLLEAALTLQRVATDGTSDRRLDLAHCLAKRSYRERYPMLTAVHRPYTGRTPAVAWRGDLPPLRGGELLALARDPVDQLPKRGGELLHAVALEHFDDVVVVDSGFREPVQRPARLVHV